MTFRLKLLSMMLLSIALTGCSEKNATPSASYIPVRVLSLQQHTGAHGSRYTANIIPNTQVNLAFKVNGYIESILEVTATDGTQQQIDRGNLVSKGKVLARIKDNQYQDKVKEAKASLASANAAWVKAQADYKRAKILYKEKSLTAPDYDSALQEYSTAQANVAAARAQLADAQQNLAYCALVAPMNGVLLNKNIAVGTLVKPASAAFVLADMSKVKVVFAVPDTMLKIISLGDPLKVTTRALADQVFSGVVSNISPSADQQTRVFEIEIAIDNAQGLLKDGMIAALQIPELSQQDSRLVFLPINAVVRSKDQPKGYAVYTIKENVNKRFAILTNVQLGKVEGNNISVLSGLKADVQVIVSGVNTVWDGAEVRIID
ncbi:efflux RND transporter periplasmic adaptor subunit [Methyloprofundus sp.]|uniref:efflux RND transporter periplasmic adaptor subunit n=1 Tax=Methyloprofundus sp. TaxID=2020875 RepID=UPI003D0C8EF0